MEVQILTLLSVLLGGLISYGSTYSIEKYKAKNEEKKQNEQNELKIRMKIFQTLEFFENKCEDFLEECKMDYYDLSDDKFPTFNLIKTSSLCHIKFLLYNNYKNEYEKFIEIEKSLKSMERYIDKEFLELEINSSICWQEIAMRLSEKIRPELDQIIKSINCMKIKVLSCTKT